jgi:hypothetical protein
MAQVVTATTRMYSFLSVWFTVSPSSTCRQSLLSCACPLVSCEDRCPGQSSLTLTLSPRSGVVVVRQGSQWVHWFGHFVCANTAVVCGICQPATLCVHLLVRRTCSVVPPKRMVSAAWLKRKRADGKRARHLKLRFPCRSLH